MENNNLDEYVPENIRDVFVNKSSASQNEASLAGENASSCKAEEEKENKGEQVMDNKPEIAEAVKAEVAAVLAEKDAQQKVEARIAGLETEKASLQEKVNELTVANESLSKQIEELGAAKSELEKKNSELVSEKESALAECESVKSELSSIKKEQLTATRKDELTKAGILISDETLQSKQIAKVSDMTDEQFADYVSELSAIANTGKKETEKAVETQATASKEEKPAEDTEKATASSLTDGQIFAQAIAGVQAPSCNADNISKYAQL